MKTNSLISSGVANGPIICKSSDAGTTITTGKHILTRISICGRTSTNLWAPFGFSLDSLDKQHKSLLTTGISFAVLTDWFPGVNGA